MAFAHLTLRAVLCDVYGTLLQVDPAPADAAERWDALWHECLDGRPRLTPQAFTAQAEAATARHHGAARRRGVAWPEVSWPQVVLEVVPEFARLPRQRLDTFVEGHRRLYFPTRLAPGADAVLLLAWSRGLSLGIVSNAQAYTQRELAAALQLAGLPTGLFEPDLCFWSFAHGFSKPDPHVFELLRARLEHRGWPADHVLMVGDRLENDLDPVERHGWRTWHLQAEPERQPGGTWTALRQWLAPQLEAPGL